MNIHSIHFEEGIKPRLRSAREPRVEQEPQQPCESFGPATTDQTQADLAKLRELAQRTPSTAG